MISDAAMSIVDAQPRICLPPRRIVDDVVDRLTIRCFELTARLFLRTRLAIPPAPRLSSWSGENVNLPSPDRPKAVLSRHFACHPNTLLFAKIWFC